MVIETIERTSSQAGDSGPGALHPGVSNVYPRSDSTQDVSIIIFPRKSQIPLKAKVCVPTHQSDNDSME